MDPGTLEKIGGKRVQRGKQGRKEGWRDGRRERVRFQKQPQDGVRRTIFSNCTTSSPEWPFFFFPLILKHILKRVTLLISGFKSLESMSVSQLVVIWGNVFKSQSVVLFSGVCLHQKRNGHRALCLERSWSINVSLKEIPKSPVRKAYLVE